MVIEYPFTEDYCHAIAAWCVTTPEYWSAIGTHLAPVGLSSEAARTVVNAVSALTEASGGMSPTSWLQVHEYLTELHSAGDLKKAKLRAAVQLVEEGLGLIENADLDAQIKQDALRVQYEHRRAALEKHAEGFYNTGEISGLMDALDQAGRIGIRTQHVGLGPKQLLARKRSTKKPQTLDVLGLPELVAIMDGEVAIGSQIIFLGGPGAGKSMALSQAAACAAMDGRNVAVVSLEVNTDIWSARYFGALLRMNVKLIQSGAARVLDTVESELDDLDPILGEITFGYLDPGVTSVDQVLAWVEDEEKRLGVTFEVLVCDYADKLIASTDSKKDQGQYVEMKGVYERLRIWAERKRRWCVTASQSKAKSRNNPKAKLNVEDGADSLHKGRVTDVMLGINTTVTDDETTTVITVAKNRNGAGLDQSTQPFAVGFENGRLTDA